MIALERSSCALAAAVLLAACATVSPHGAESAAARAAAAFVAALEDEDAAAVTVLAVTSASASGIPAGCHAALLSFAPTHDVQHVRLSTRAGEASVLVSDDGSRLALCGRTDTANDPLLAVVHDVALLHRVSTSSVIIDDREAITWTDGALGCPAPGGIYTQATVPGYRLILRLGSGSTAEIHTDRDGSSWVECADGRPVRRGSTR